MSLRRPACHAGGRGFESRPLRQISLTNPQLAAAQIDRRNRCCVTKLMLCNSTHDVGLPAIVVLSRKRIDAVQVDDLVIFLPGDPQVGGRGGLSRLMVIEIEHPSKALAPPHG